jgi:hypothetical protein
MKAIHGGKAKNDKIDPRKIAVLLRIGNLYALTEGNLMAVRLRIAALTSPSTPRPKVCPLNPKAV